MHSSITATALLTCVYLVYRAYVRGQRKAELPPGPKPWPLLGNITDLPPQGMPEYQHWLKHKDTYGPISSVTVLGQTMVIIHDLDAIQELMEKKSLLTSDRPRFEFAHNLSGFGKYLSLRPYDDSFRRQRKVVHQQLGTKALVEQYRAVQEEEVGRLLLRLLEDPQNLWQSIKTKAGAIILKITYGYTVQQRKIDPLVKLIEEMMTRASKALVPMSYAVDLLPALRHIPAWFPGASFQRVAKKTTDINRMVTDVPYNFVRQRMAQQTHTPSYVSRLIEELQDEELQLDPVAVETIKWSAGIMYAGGSDTTVSSLYSVILALVKFPQVQRRAQREIDGLTGSERLPQFEDRDQLPYVNGVVKEALRWFPVTPMGVAHAAGKDIMLKGYLVPKGAIILPAVWWLLHDPEVYADPDSFDPARYLPPRDEPDPARVAFGFGRRVCPGKYLADASIFLTVAQLVAVFEVSKALDDEGREIEPVVASGLGLLDHPASFPYKMTPRSAKHASLIRSNEMGFSGKEADADALRAAGLKGVF
uniref:Cytochrome P450 n=1 Tax=Photinus pyralis TaxID=7054 RepID=A0A1Y1K2G7_PHOPY